MLPLLRMTLGKAGMHPEQMTRPCRGNLLHALLMKVRDEQKKSDRWRSESLINFSVCEGFSHDYFVVGEENKVTV